MSLSAYSRNKLMELLSGKTAWSTPTAYISLHTGDPSTTGANEVANSYSYARKSTAGADWNSASGGIIDNANAITFTSPSGGNWGDVTHFGIWDSGTYGAGNFLVGGALGTTYTIQNGNTVSFAAGAFEIDASGA